ncbi:MAG: PilZ domain-containing protein [Deltaproteobacteria bacterium]|nr:PilZ domain-containing protein [Deltaproteobacteria bacterium]
METGESRMHERVPFTGRVAVLASPSSPPLRLLARDLGEGGISLASNHPFRRGDRVGLRLTTAAHELTIPVSEVAWVVREVKGSSRIPTVGLRFINLRPHERQALKRIVDEAGGAHAALPPLQPAGDSPPLPSTEPAMHAEPTLASSRSSLPPLESDLPAPSGAPFSSLPPLEPSIGHAPAPRTPRWELSQEELSRPSGPPRAGGNPSLVFAGGLLVVGTLAGLVFGVLDQRGRASPDGARTAAASPAPRDEPAPVDPVTAPAEDARPEPAPAMVAPVRQAPVARAAPVRTEPVATAMVLRPAAAATAVERRPAVVEKPLPLPNHRPGRVALGTPAVQGKEVVIAVRGARAVDKQFILRAPDRVVLDLAADGFDGAKELAGRASVRKLRLGQRPGGVRLVVDVADARVAAAAKVIRRAGTLLLVLPAK